MSVRGSQITEIKEENQLKFDAQYSGKLSSSSKMIGLTPSFHQNRKQQLSIMKYLSDKKKSDKINLENVKMH